MKLKRDKPPQSEREKQFCIVLGGAMIWVRALNDADYAAFVTMVTLNTPAAQQWKTRRLAVGRSLTFRGCDVVGIIGQAERI